MRFMPRRQTLAMSENQLKKLLVVLCDLTVVLTRVSAIKAFEPLRAGFIWTVERVHAAFNWAVQHKPRPKGVVLGDRTQFAARLDHSHQG